MKRNIALKWARALESGKYKQGSEFLKDNASNTFCCMGVLCDISKQGTWTKYPDNYLRYVTNGQASSAELTDSVREWSGMNSSDGSYKGIDREYSLVGWNDHGYGNVGMASFKEIAAFIRKYYKAL